MCTKWYTLITLEKLMINCKEGKVGAPAGTIVHHIGRNMTVARPNVPKMPTDALLSSGKP